MKYTLKLICVLLFTINASCQVTTIVPLSSYNYPNGAYLKDLDNVLVPYVGTWEGIIDNKKYTFVFQIFNQHQYINLDGSYHYRDILKGKFKVVDISNNQTLYDNLTANNYDDYSIFGIGKISPDFSFFFRDTEAHCSNSVKFNLQNIVGQPNKLKYCNFKFKPINLDGCNYQNQTDIPMYLPKVELILTKL